MTSDNGYTLLIVITIHDPGYSIARLANFVLNRLNRHYETVRNIIHSHQKSVVSTYRVLSNVDTWIANDYSLNQAFLLTISKTEEKIVTPNSDNHRVSFRNTYYPRESIDFWLRNIVF